MPHSFFSLIDDLNAAPPAGRSGIEAAIWKTFGVEMAVMSLDMSQFSLTVRRRGIVTYLAMIRHMQVIAGALVRDAGGQVVKYHADNLMAVFDEPIAAVTVAIRINHALALERSPAHADAYSVSIGIDFGRFLKVGDVDCYGDPVNVAYKLAEDLGRSREVLITEAVRERLGESFAHPLLEQQVSVSGLEFTAYSVQYPAAALRTDGSNFAG